MGAPARASPRLCRLLLPGGAFLVLLLYLSSLRLQLHRRSACIWGGQPCHWLGDLPPNEEEGEQLPPLPAPAQTLDPLLWQTPHPPCRGQHFQIWHLQSAFAASLTPSREVLIGEYLKGWKELTKFMDSLGTAFGLITRETWSKITIMQDYQSGQHGAHYRTLQSMVTFELANGLVNFHSLPATHPPSGCRTLLRLHRALRWLQLFLDKLGSSEGGDASQMCASAYQETLAPYHSWWVRQAAALAFLAMPSQRELYGIICAEKEQHARTTLLATVRIIAHVYNITQEVFSAHEMLELP
ncbi:glycolipid transfer protein domain-containing protein 2 isoform X2 [Eublepharis macularius]|uniref:Glycolipid transfer protein domain-containing protein 2 isoform X2 n=1 Tax=Eublepharis macularius TaxID=481883 RepID=A0AA97K463_EUBMA|nr:glycolipid transfer protein domain-containing protein 2 isoform X2 [Eublepharis macularius]